MGEARKAGLSTQTIETLRGLYLAYKDQCAAAGFTAKRPKAGCWVYCAETEAEARERGSVWLRNYAESALRHYEYLEPEHFKQAKGYEYQYLFCRGSGHGVGNAQAQFLPRALAERQLVPAPEPEVVGKGLDKIQDAFMVHKQGVSAKKIVVAL